jgi:hypothetical protein
VNRPETKFKFNVRQRCSKEELDNMIERQGMLNIMKQNDLKGDKMMGRAQKA